MVFTQPPVRKQAHPISNDASTASAADTHSSRRNTRENAMATLLPQQNEYIRGQAAGKTEEMKTAARNNDKVAHSELNAQRALSCNSECFDCTARKPGWAVLPWGVHICIDCAQVHRNLGRHVSQTKAINTGTYLWFDHERPVMRAVGNGVAARAFGAECMAAKPSRDAAPEVKAAYAQAKYVDFKWGAPNFEAAAALRRDSAVAAQPARAVLASLAPQPAPEPKTAAISASTASWKAAGLAVAKPTKPTIAKPPADWDDLFADLAPASAPAAPRAPPRSGDAASDILRLFDPLPMMSPQPPTKVAVPAPLGDTAFFAQFGL